MKCNHTNLLDKAINNIYVYTYTHFLPSHLSIYIHTHI